MKIISFFPVSGRLKTRLGCNGFRLLALLGSFQLQVHGSLDAIVGGEVSYLAPGPSARLELNSMRVAAVDDPWPGREFSTCPGGGMDRTSWRLDRGQLSHIPKLREPRGGKVFDALPSGFDCWALLDALQAPPQSCLIAAFRVRSAVSRTVYLGLGCDDEAVVFQDGLPVFATMGRRRDYIRTQNLVPITLNPGGAEISILLRKFGGWAAIPTKHNSQEWIGGFELYGSAESAWAGFRSHNFSFTDTSIVSTLEDVRVNADPPASRALRLLDIRGREVAVGEINDSGSVSWQAHAVALPSLGFLSLRGEGSEGILITGNRSLEAAMAMLPAQGSDASDAWRLRRDYLLLQPKGARELWWTRKMVLALLMTCGDPKSPEVVQRFADYPAAQLQFHDYVSRVDGSRQYFRIARLKPNEDADWPLLVMLPTVTSPVRPFLDSQEIADERGAENVAALAAENRLMVLWPGNTEVDYGGDLALTEIEEAVDATKALLGREKIRIFLSGVCSSGVTAIRYAETHAIQGLILQSPVIRRSRWRWISGLRLDDPHYPAEVLAAEQTDLSFERLRGVPLYLVYNSGMPGHGDRMGSLFLCDRMRRLGSEVEAHWPLPDAEWVWGERERALLAPAVAWAGRHRDTIIPAGSAAAKPNRSVKGALLKGFQVVRPEDETLQLWLDWWESFRAEYRGQGQEDFAWRPPHSPKTVLRFKLLDSDEMDEIRAGRFIDGNASPEFESLRGSLQPQDQLWGFRLLPDQDPETVEVFRSSSVEDSPPKIDLILDGCCRGALWRRTDGGWSLIGCWLSSS